MSSSEFIRLASVASVFLIAVVVAFQTALAAGAPWGAAAYGGRFVEGDGRLPTRYRLSSAVTALVLLAIAWLMLAAGSVIGQGPVPDLVLTASVWVLAGLFTLNTAGNLSGKHPVERFGASAFTAALTVLCIAIAAGR
ncbi:MAG: hypothetical protein JWN68_2571 [Nocardioides sp.]|jgi:hypothetical protein|uniref:hypothetical protein n=1 Tax=Nocardioides sp. TaxID=35761 RepID=UPI0026102DB4|nr:hypothetical protein [Nocardioides sp.]MCW2834618.1 hypothetical protein [Nocardioides sp.]